MCIRHEAISYYINSYHILLSDKISKHMQWVVLWVKICYLYLLCTLLADVVIH